MRQIFTSTRLENAEGVAKLLEDAGIATKISGGRSWKGNSRREFSYSTKNDDSSTQPAVWVLNADDFKRARELLHQGGLLEATRDVSYLPENLQFKDAPGSGGNRLFRIKLVLLAVIAGGAALILMRMLS